MENKICELKVSLNLIHLPMHLSITYLISQTIARYFNCCMKLLIYGNVFNLRTIPTYPFRNNKRKCCYNLVVTYN